MKSKDPVGNSLTVEGKKGIIIGVFEDFHTIDLAGSLVPTIISLNAKNRSTLLIRFSSGSHSEMIEKISRIYKRYDSDIPFQPVLFNDLPDYSRLITTSNLVGLAFLIGKAFLSRFYFRTPISFWTFMAGPLISYIVALLAVCWQSWRAATKNPLESLSYE